MELNKRKVYYEYIIKSNWPTNGSNNIRTYTSSESNVEKDKGHVSDAFKRACVSWGIGRFLYRLPIQTLTTKQWKGKDYPYAPEKDKIIFDGETLTKYINWKIKNNK